MQHTAPGALLVPGLDPYGPCTGSFRDQRPTTVGSRRLSIAASSRW